MAKRKVDPVSNGHKTALIYCRVSTKSQQEEGTSLDTQAEACIRQAESLGYSIGRVTKEVYSGAELWDRPLLSRDRADIRSGQFQALICYAIDRLSRDIAHLAILAEECERAGCGLVFVTEDLDNSPQGKLLRSVQSYVAEVEREKIKERTLRGKRQRLLAGKIHNLGPELYGYRRDKESGVRKIYEPEARVVQQIFDWVAVERVGFFNIAKRLTASGIASPYAAKGFGLNCWNATTVGNMIRNPAYKGETVQWVRRTKNRRGRSHLMEPRPESEHIILPSGITPAIVTPEQWQQAQERSASNKGETKRNEKSPYLLRGHITCGKCRKRMYPMPSQGKNGRRYRYYRCSSEAQIQYQRCGVSVVPADSCEEWVWEEVKQYLEKPDLIAAEVERMQMCGTDPQLVLDREITQGALERNLQGQQRLVRRLREADDTLAELIERELIEAEKEHQRTLKAIAELDMRIGQQEKAALNLKNLYEYCRDVKQNLSSFNFDEKRLALTALGVEVVANGHHWRLVGTLPGGVVEVKSASSSCLHKTCKLTLSHHPAEPVPPSKRSKAQKKNVA